MSAPILALDSVSASYGAFQALHAVSLALEPGDVVAVLGANGAGKSTLARVGSGLLVPTAGTVAFAGEVANGRAPHVLARQGLVHLNEGRSCFADLSVEENLTIARTGPMTRRQRRSRLGALFDQFPQLKDRRHQRAGTLSGGEQRLLSILRAVLDPPKVLLADELSLGLSPIATATIYAALAVLRDHGCAMAIIEQQVPMVTAFAARAVVLDRGQVIFTGSCDEAIEHVESVVRGRQAFLGSER
jgi:branched-chain amino acid transport system ATP-binding protein